MLKRLRNRLSARGLRRGAGPAPAQRLIVEELEPWILMSADAAPALTALGDPLMAEQEIYELLEQSIAARVELVFIDDRVAADDAVLANLAAQTDSGTRLEVVVIDSRRETQRGRTHFVLTRFYQDDELAVLAATTMREVATDRPLGDA